ncbi:MAG: hypothetical protein ACR2PZ_10090, partial [Pseudomonadales bacterium]
MFGKLTKLLLLTALIVPLASHASLIGDTIDVSFSSPEGSGSANDVEVTSAVEFQGPGFGLIDGEFIDVTSDSIITAIIEPFDPGGAVYEFSSLDWVGTTGQIVGVELTLDGVVGLDSSDITFGDDFVRVDVTDVDKASDVDRGLATIRLITQHQSTT